MGRRGASTPPTITTVMDRAESFDGIVPDCQCPSCLTRGALLRRVQRERTAPKRPSRTFWSDNIQRLLTPSSLDLWK